MKAVQKDQRLWVSLPQRRVSFSVRRGASARAVRPRAARAAWPSPPISAPAVKSARSSTRLARISAAARVPPPSQRMRVRPLAARACRAAVGFRMRAVGGGFDQEAPVVGPGGAGGCRGGGGVDQPDRGLPGGAAKAAVGGMAEAAVQHDADGLVGAPMSRTRQVRVIGAGGAGADHHRIMAHAQGMDGAARRGPGDPAGFARGGGDAAIERGGEFQGDEGQALRHPFEKTCIGGGGLAPSGRFR